jgi:flagellar motor switch protein FliM
MSMPLSELLIQLNRPDSSGDDRRDDSGREELQRQVGKSDVDLTVTLGTEILSVEDIVDLRPGRLIELTSTVSTPVVLWSGGVAAFEGRLARAGDRLAVSITASLT